ncbi:MAG: GNAT family protein [Candidatus ainarchaeum sp.]|nr:GNAT family protein [Candidatus ainarchaeum sp.]
MEIKTKNLILRELNSKDCLDVLEIFSNIKITKWMLKYRHPFTKEHAKFHIKKAIKSSKEKIREYYTFGIELKKEKKLVGQIGLKVDLNQNIGELNYALNENYQKRGIGSEALEKVLEFAFKKLKLRKVSAGYYPENKPSRKLLEKFGFKKEGYLREEAICKADMKVKDVVMNGLLRKEYK